MSPRHEHYPIKIYGNFESLKWLKDFHSQDNYNDINDYVQLNLETEKLLPTIVSKTNFTQYYNI